MKRGTERGPYAKTADVRRKIVEACMEAFAAAGFQATTMAEVARRAGISHNGLLHHFPTKEDLLLAVIERRDAQVAATLAGADAPDAEGDPREILASSIRATAPETSSVADLELDAVLSGEASVAEHPAHAAIAERYEGIRHFYARLLGQLSDQDRLLITGSDPDMLATMLLALAEGLRQQWLFDKDGVDVAASMDLFFDLVVKGESS
ncbi:TetR/AcrR family transcriptional regulator [Microbacter sp. GSS18]|nr:TetR/AcrR family transcriptional regulator [Microbacter sp. GSS18]